MALLDLFVGRLKQSPNRAKQPLGKEATHWICGLPTEALEPRIHLSSYTLTTLATLTIYNAGVEPSAVILSGNTLYGTTPEGGANGTGDVVSVPITGSSPTILASAPYDAKQVTSAPVLIGSTVYFTTEEGGAYEDGAIFSVPITGGTPAVFASFNAATPYDSDSPSSLYLFGSTLYGTAGGGVYGWGQVFSEPLTGGTPATLASFGYLSSPTSALTLYGSTLYGTTYDDSISSHVVYSVPVAGGTPNVLGSVPGTEWNGGAQGTVIVSGNTVYGTTPYGGVNNDGTVFSLPITGGTATILASFNGSDGSFPLAGLTLSGGTLYGTTFDGDQAGLGGVFSEPISGGTPTVIASFNGASGGDPAAALTISGGSLYGTTYADGYISYSTVFVVSPTVTAVSWTGASGGIWATDSNWSLATVPTSTINANFSTGSATPYTVTLTGASSANNLNVQGDNVTVQMGGNNLALSGALAISPGTSNTGFLTFQGTGTSTAGQNVATVPGGVSIGSSATNAPALTVNSAAINGNVANYGNLTFLNSGTLTATNNATVTGTLTNDGFMATGSSNASGPSVIGGNVVAVQGNYVQTSAGLLQTEISGSSSVSSDQIDVSGTDTLAGNLAIIQNSSFAPTPGVPIPLLRYSSYTGSFNTSIQSGVTSNSSYLGLSYKPQELDLEATPPLATLANLSANIYSGVSGFANFIPLTTNSLLIPSQAAYTGFDAVAYDTTDLSNSQIIIAFRGTDVSNGVTAMKNAAADVSFTGGDQPTPDLETSTSYAAAFVKQIEADYPNAFITLTGHSLGGAIAQLVGKASGLSTVAFNAPGAEQLYSALSTNLQVGTWSPSAGVNVNYRIYGDQVSLVGMPVGSVVTLPQPVGTTFISNSDPAKEVVSNLLTFLQLHDRNTVVAQIGMQPVSETGELNDANAFQAAAVAGAGMTKGQELIQITLNVIAGAGTLIDPSGGTAFTLAEQTGSPAITSVDFPALTGVTSYDLRQEVNEVWSTYQIIPAGSSYTLPSGTTAIDFTPLNSSDSPVILTDAFLFDANFAATGTFTGTIASNFSVWTGQADGTSWSNPGNWSGDMVPTEGDDAYIGSGFGTVMIPAGTFAVNALTAASPVEVASGGILALYGSSAINGSGASLTIDSGGTVQIDTTGSSSNPGPLIVSNLSIAGTLDLGSSALDVQGGSLSTITREIASGYNGGKWTGTGITSSSAATNSQHLNALGVIQNNQSGLALFTSVNLFDGIVPGASDVLVKYTDYGDALLNGNVTAADYLQIDNADSYNQAHSSTPLTGWYNGDFNYDGVINGDDYTMIDNAYNSQGSVGFAASPASQIAANKAQMAETADATGSSKGHATPGGSPAVAPAAQGVTAAIGDAAELRKKHSNLWATLEEDNS